jgi:predicted  nucleic acid-binding Zn-ribbon protein
MALIDELEGAAMELPHLQKENTLLKKKLAQYKHDMEGLQIDTKVYRDNIKELEKQVAELSCEAKKYEKVVEAATELLMNSGKHAEGLRDEMIEKIRKSIEAVAK